MSETEAKRALSSRRGINLQNVSDGGNGSKKWYSAVMGQCGLATPDACVHDTVLGLNTILQQKWKGQWMRRLAGRGGGS